jgi:hypothetical protein
MKVSLNEAKIRATPKTCSPSLTAGPRVTVSSFGSLTFLFDDYNYINQNMINYQILTKTFSIIKGKINFDTKSTKQIEIENPNS